MNKAIRISLSYAKFGQPFYNMHINLTDKWYTLVGGHNIERENSRRMGSLIPPTPICRTHRVTNARFLVLHHKTYTQRQIPHWFFCTTVANNNRCQSPSKTKRGHTIKTTTMSTMHYATTYGRSRQASIHRPSSSAVRMRWACTSLHACWQANNIQQNGSE